MLTACKLNNKSLRNQRKEPLYQAIIIDLALSGEISKEAAEKLIGGGLPADLHLADGTSNLWSEKDSAAEEDDD